MRQRVLIAIALAAKPRVLIADEPTTALDPTIQTQILALLKELQQRFNMSLILISHDIGVVARLCDRIFVMYAGKIVEKGSAIEVLNSPLHPYTCKLLHSLPRLDSVHGQPLCAIDGSPPSLFSPPAGCAFAPRCSHAMPICHCKEPPLGLRTSCWLNRPGGQTNDPSPHSSRSSHQIVSHQSPKTHCRAQSLIFDRSGPNPGTRG